MECSDEVLFVCEQLYFIYKLKKKDESTISNKIRNFRFGMCAYNFVHAFKVWYDFFNNSQRSYFLNRERLYQKARIHQQWHEKTYIWSWV